MCGICGFVGPGGEHEDEAVVARMCETLRHRGPDGEGRHRLTGPGIGGWFGHLRLRILDLSEAAAQPMTCPDAPVVLTYNGEVYNYRTLRAELEALGHRFRSTGDTEVVLRSYLQWGEDFVTRIDGMFALALWDGDRDRLLLARDRTGKKPLFYSVADDRLTFGSEIKSLIAAPWVRWEPALETVPQYLAHGYVPHPDTMLRGIEQVPPAAVVTFDGSGAPSCRSYWDVPRPSLRPKARTDARFCADLRSDFEAAVHDRLASDVPLGALLSGGIDSSLVVATMSRLTDVPVHTFCIGFDDHVSFDEREYARLVAAHCGTDHEEFVVRPDAVALLDTLLWHHDQPFGDTSAVPTFLVSQLARQKVTVVLNGDGGDEVFAGYDRFVAAKLAQAVPAPLARLGQTAARALPDDGGYYSRRRRASRFFQDAGRPLLDAYQGWTAVFGQQQLARFVRPEVLTAPGAGVGRTLQQYYDRWADLPALDRILYGNFKTYLPDDLAVKMDRMSMAHSLEARSPFLDTRVIELVNRLPTSDRIGLRTVKPILRKAFEPDLPREIWERRKHGFGVPVDHWFRGPLSELFEDEVLAPDARTSEFLDQQALAAALGDHKAGRSQEGDRLWTVLSLERWLRNGAAPVGATPVGALADRTR